MNTDKRRADYAANATKYRKVRTEWRAKVDTGKGSVKQFLASLLSGAKNNTRGLTCTVTVDELLALWSTQQGLCAISHTTMVVARLDLRSMSIDRIDSSKGYHLDNVQLVCQWINSAKRNHADDELLAILRNYAAHHTLNGGKDNE